MSYKIHAQTILFYLLNKDDNISLTVTTDGYSRVEKYLSILSTVKDLKICILLDKNVFSTHF